MRKTRQTSGERIVKDTKCKTRKQYSEHNNTHDMAKNDCCFDILVAARWTGDISNPIPAKCQSYESGYEPIDQSITAVARSYREYMDKQNAK